MKQNIVLELYHTMERIEEDLKGENYHMVEVSVKAAKRLLRKINNE